MVEQSMDVAFVIAGKLREGKERIFNGVRVMQKCDIIYQKTRGRESK